MYKHTDNKEASYKNKSVKIESVHNLCEIIGINYRELLSLMGDLENNYQIFMLKKKQGGFRQIVAPSDNLKCIQRRIYKEILLNIKLDISCVGFSEGTSIVKNASFHQNKEAVLRLDLFRFFDTITYQRILGLFSSFGYSREIASYLAKLTTVMPINQYLDEIKNDKAFPKKFSTENVPRLPQGAPTSPIISNIIATKLDIRLRNLAEKVNITYTRYADDIIFSGSLELLPSYAIIKKIILEEGFFVNIDKVTLKKRGQKQIVTGLTVTNGVHVPKQFKQKIKTNIYYCLKYGVKSHLERIGENDESKFRTSLKGKISHVYAVEPFLAKSMFEEYNNIKWSV